MLEQQRTWSLSTLLRAETAEGAVWLKSCMPRFHAEPALGRWLSEDISIPFREKPEDDGWGPAHDDEANRH